MLIKAALKRPILPLKIKQPPAKNKTFLPLRPALVRQVLMTSPKPFTQLFLDHAANLTGRHQHVNKQLGGKGCPPGNYLLALLQGSGQAYKKKSLTPEHMPTSFKEIPQPQAINHFSETPPTAGLYTDLHQEQGLLGSSPHFK